MAMLDDMLARLGGVNAPPPGMPQWPGDPTATDQAAAAEEARNVAAQRLRRGTIRQPAPLQGMGPIPYVGNSGPFTDPNAPAAAAPAPAAPPASAPMQSQHPVPNDPTWGAPQPAGQTEDAAPKGDDASLLPANSQPTAATTPPPGVEPTQAQGTATSAPAAGPSPMGMLSKLFNPNNAATLLALGSGFAGAPSLGTGMRRAFGAAVPAVAADRANTLKQEGIAAKYQSLVQQLVAKGVPQAEAAQMALGAVYSPDQEKALIGKYFDTKLPEWKVVRKNPDGTEEYGYVNPNDQSVNSGFRTLPSRLANQPQAAQRQLAPDGWTGIDKATNRAVIRRGTNWVYADDNSPVPK